MFSSTGNYLQLRNTNIGAEDISVRDLIERGYYLGSNASYNLKNLIDGGYVSRQASARDRRSAHLKVTAKGQEVLAKLAALELQWVQPMMTAENATLIEATHTTLRAIERCWSDAVRYEGTPHEAEEVEGLEVRG